MLKKKWMKILTCLMLCLTLAVGSVWVAYETPQEVEAVAIEGTVAIILAILAACGIGYTGYVIADQPLDAWVDERQQELPGLEDEIGAILENPDFKVVFDNFYQETGTPNPDEDPDQDPDNKPSRWQQFKDWIKKNYDTTTGIPLAGASAAILMQLRGKLAELSKNGDLFSFKDQQKLKDNGVIFPEDYRDMLAKYPYYAINFYHSVDIDATITTIRMAKKPYAFFKDKFNNFTRLRYQTPGIMPWAEYSSLSGWREFNYNFDSSYSLGTLEIGDYITNCPVFDMQSEAVAYVSNANKDDSLVYPYKASPFNPETTALSSKLQEAPDTHEIPNQVYMPTEAQLQDYLNQLQNAQSTADRQSAVDNLISAITTPVTDPGTDPGNPDNPDVTPTPDPENPDDPSGGMTADLRLVFPFCIPFDLVHLFQAFDAEPVAPKFTIPFKMNIDNPFTKKQLIAVDHTITIDLAEYESVVQIFRIFEVILFIIGLMMITRSQMIKG
ncbi:hypothetical protein [Ruminococcus gauvreauii]|uniref:hypothetical protein n=1 Tax=Ruminococcus gauvreauii TaxID=438033 RepID=UPI003983FE2F